MASQEHPVEQSRFAAGEAGRACRGSVPGLTADWHWAGRGLRSRSRSTHATCAIKLFWEKSLRRTWPAEVDLVRADPQFKLPVVLSATEIRLLLDRLPDGRVRALLDLAPQLTEAERAAWQPFEGAG